MPKALTLIANGTDDGKGRPAARPPRDPVR